MFLLFFFISLFRVMFIEFVGFIMWYWVLSVRVLFLYLFNKEVLSFKFLVIGLLILGGICW